MDFGLKGKVALVAASSRGLGRAVAEELATEGCKLVMCSRTVRSLEDARSDIFNRTGAEVVVVPANLTDPEDVKRVVAAGEGDCIAGDGSSQLQKRDDRTCEGDCTNEDSDKDFDLVSQHLA